jgi:hypothetical protein
MITICTTCCFIKNLCILTTVCVFRMILRKTVVISLNSINLLVFVEETQCDFCEVETLFLALIHMNVRPDYSVYEYFSVRRLN